MLRFPGVPGRSLNPKYMHYGIIAAGEGSRLVQEGVSRPKPLIELNGEPMIQRLIKVFADCGAESISVIVNEQMTEVQEFLRELAPQLNVPLNLIVKSTPSSMHSFYELSRLMKGKGKFILTTVDTIFRPDDFAAYVQAFDRCGSDTDGMMAITPYVDDEKPLWVRTDNGGNILGFLDSNDGECKFVSGGIYGLTEPAIGVLEDCMERGVSRMRNYQRALVEAGLKLKGYSIPKVLDVDHAGDIVKAQVFLSRPI